MSWFKKIFGSQAKNKPETTVPFLHELYRFESEEEGYILWKNKEQHRALKDLIFYAFAKFSNENITHTGMHFMSDHKVKAIAIDCNHYEFNRKDYLYFITYIIEELKNLGYILNLSDIRSERIRSKLTKTTRAYLKPSRKLTQGSKALQLYGNINMELQSVDNTVYQFKLINTVYSDQHFHDPMDFRLLINQIFKNE